MNHSTSSPTLAKDLMNPEVRQKVADAHVEAILEIERDGV